MTAKLGFTETRSVRSRQSRRPETNLMNAPARSMADACRDLADENSGKGVHHVGPHLERTTSSAAPSAPREADGIHQQVSADQPWISTAGNPPSPTERRRFPPRGTPRSGAE